MNGGCRQHEAWQARQVGQYRCAVALTRTRVVVLGAGPAGLTVANLLRKAGVDCVLLEQRSRAYIEQRARAGFIEEWAVRALQQHGLADNLLVKAQRHDSFEFR